MSRAYSMTGREVVMPWLPLPETITTGISQPLIRASDPAAAAALARTATSSPYRPRRVLPTSAPQPPFNPSSEMALLYATWRLKIDSTSFTSRQSANSMISLTDSTERSVCSSPPPLAASAWNSTVSSRWMRVIFVWKSTISQQAECSPAMTVMLI